MPSILYLVPDVFGQPGGIARYIRLICNAFPPALSSLTLLSLMDGAQSAAQAGEALPAAHYLPCAGSRPRFVRQALAQAATRRPDLVLVGHPNFAALGWLAARLADARLIAFVYGIDVWQPLPPVRRWGLRQAHRVIAISRFTAQQAISTNDIDVDRVRVLHNCLDPQLLPPTSRHNDTAARPILLAVARLSRAEKYKGHDQVLHAIAGLLPRFPDLLFNVVGDGDWRPDLEALAAKLGVTRAVRFHRRVSDAELLRRYAEATLFVLPSRGEGFGFVFLEAMAHGLPVVAGKLDATPEVVADGETGLLVDPSSPAAIAEAVASLLADPERRARMSAAAQRRVQEHFSFAGFQRQLTDILVELDPRWSFQA